MLGCFFIPSKCIDISSNLTYSLLYLIKSLYSTLLIKSSNFLDSPNISIKVSIFLEFNPKTFPISLKTCLGSKVEKVIILATLS